ncbi:transmembrane protein 220-like [Paramacrobiotus metropolitanus]|uniref:transmembrane protein 220-like n=1 Tax=Paramacrobiotus metropolitanus TaxID=2943436 RepID=UPI002445E65D|nr:transmembrane protein 220-like [Paramacrobiotus metropolitanus]
MASGCSAFQKFLYLSGQKFSDNRAYQWDIAASSPEQLAMSDTDRLGVRMRVGINLGMMMLFALCAVVQFNDPDPYIWVPIYGFPCLLCFQEMVSPRILETVCGFLLRSMHLLFCLGVLGYVIGEFVEHRSSASKALLMEYGREFSGIALVMGWHIINYVFLHRAILVQRKMEAGGAFVVLVIVLVTTSWTCFRQDYYMVNVNSNGTVDHGMMRL